MKKGGNAFGATMAAPWLSLHYLFYLQNRSCQGFFRDILPPRDGLRQPRPALATAAAPSGPAFRRNKEPCDG